MIILTARSEKEDRIRGLTMGADDYVVKPFALDELLARIRAVLRRVRQRPESLNLGDTVIDFQRLQARRGKQEIVLTDREFEVLRHLTERAGSVVSRDELLHLVWGYWDTRPHGRSTISSFVCVSRSSAIRIIRNTSIRFTGADIASRLATERRSV